MKKPHITGTHTSVGIAWGWNHGKWADLKFYDLRTLALAWRMVGVMR